MKWLNRTFQVAIAQHLLITWHVNYKAKALAFWKDQDVLEKNHFILKVVLFFQKSRSYRYLSHPCRCWESDIGISKIWGHRTETGTKHISSEFQCKKGNDSLRNWCFSRSIMKGRETLQSPKCMDLLSAKTGQIKQHWLTSEPSSTLWMRLTTLILIFKDLINKHSFRDCHGSQKMTGKPRWWGKGITWLTSSPTLFRKD